MVNLAGIIEEDAMEQEFTYKIIREVAVLGYFLYIAASFCRDNSYSRRKTVESGAVSE